MPTGSSVRNENGHEGVTGHIPDPFRLSNFFDHTLSAIAAIHPLLRAARAGTLAAREQTAFVRTSTGPFSAGQYREFGLVRASSYRTDIKAHQPQSAISDQSPLTAQRLARATLSKCSVHHPIISH
jgi:hypothetical protein